MLLPPIDASISAAVPRRYRAGALSLRNSSAWLGTTLGPILFTSLAAVVGYRPLLLAGGVAALAVASVFALPRPFGTGRARRTRAD
jgi:MFS family permease